jgi:hypothetical protein
MCHESSEALGWGIPVERLSGSGVELVGDSFKFAGAMDRQICALWKILAQ